MTAITTCQTAVLGYKGQDPASTAKDDKSITRPFRDFDACGVANGDNTGMLERAFNQWMESEMLHICRV